jgi:hypothetical protein
MQSVSVSSVIEMLSEKGKVLLIVAYIKRKHDVIVEAFLEHNHESDSDQTLNRQKLSN